jgi:glycosyltransferase involved in cell wall biosynthesis
MNVNQISIALPSYNTLNYTMMAYNSLRKYYPSNEIIIMDDGSTDGSWEWTEAQLKLDPNLRTYHNTTGNIIGHTVTYNIAAKMCKGPLYTIFHSDMIAYKGYLENMLKHWQPKTVVCATRIEPEGIYPQGKEKILKPFGIEFHEFKQQEFEAFCEQEQKDSKDKTSNGIFAPWLISKEDYLNTGGMHETFYSPYPEEDADWFLRLTLVGYTLIQSRDSLCWHWISRGHRSWAKNGVGKDDDMFKFYQNRARRNYLRKWHKWMSFDENHHPIAHPVYNIGFVITDVTSEDFLHFIETWATNIFIDNTICGDRYIAKEQPTTKIDLSTRIYNHSYIEQVNNDILLYFSQKDFMINANENSAIITKLTDIIAGGVEDNAEMELGIFKLKTKIVKDISKSLIKV